MRGTHPRAPRPRRALWLGLVACCMVISCRPSELQRSSHGGPVRDHVSLVDNLRARGLAVEIGGEIEQPFLAVKGISLTVRDRESGVLFELQSFEYGDSGDARADARHIEPDGSPRTQQISWIDLPHFFRKERVIVLYVGSDTKALELLTEVLGPQFAGGSQS